MTQSLSLLKSLLLVGFLALLAGCKQPVEIVSPAKNAVSNSAPEFRIRFNNGVPASFTATLNGTAIDQSRFTIAGNDAVLQVTDSMLKIGDNEFAVTQPNAVKVLFHLDRVGPVIHIKDGGLGSQRQVSGYVSDRGGVASLTLNGTPVTLGAGGQFSASVTETTLFDLVATDIYGYTRREQYAKLGQAFNPAIGVRINQQGLADSVPNAVLKIVESLNFNAFITNPVSESCSDALIAYACGNFNINNIRLTPGSRVAVQALSGNRIRALINLSRLDLNTTATTYARCKSFLCGGNGTIFGTLNFTGTTTVQNTAIAAEFVVAVNNGNVSVQIVDGTLDVDLPLNGLQVDIDYGAVESVPFIGDLLNTLLNGIINGLVGVLSSIIVDIADGFLAGPISSLLNTLITDLLPKSIAIPVGTTAVDLGFSPSSFSTSSGGFSLALANSLSIRAADPDVLPPLGSYYVAGAAPANYPTTTRDGTAVDLSATVSANLLNQVLTEAYKGGLLNISLDDDDGLTIGTLFGIPNMPIDLDGVNDFRVDITGAVPPVVTVLPQANAAQGVIGVRLLDLNVKLLVDLGNGRGLQEILNTTLDLESPFDIGVTLDNRLTVGMEAAPEINIQSFLFQLNGVKVSSGSSATVNNFINTIAPQLVPKALAAIGGIPVPAIQGFTLQVKDIWNPNATNSGYLSLAGNLVSAAAAANAQPPIIDAQVAAQPFSLFGSISFDARRRATLRLDGFNPGTDPLEFRYRVNNGAWTVWKPRNTITLSYLPAGDNAVDVCGRTDLLQEHCTQVIVSAPSAQ